MKQKAEARRNELLKEKLNKRHSKNAKEYNTKKEFTSFFPKQDTVKAIEITDKIPVFAFGENIYVKKNSPSLVYTMQYFIQFKTFHFKFE